MTPSAAVVVISATIARVLAAVEAAVAAVVMKELL
jgi:hypothetical protein